MTDNTELNTGSGGDVIATDDIGGVKHQRVKIQHGDDGSASDVSQSSPLPICIGDTTSMDAFARLRVSNPDTLFDSKQLHDSLPRRWDDQEVSGSGTSSTYNSNQASTTIAVSNVTAGKRIRQTFMRFNYQPGKSQLILMTATIGATGAGTGIKSAVGQFDDENGIFFRDNGGVLQAVIRSFVTGSAVDDAVNQADWNVDKLDGTGASGITIDPTKAQILMFDYEWLGVGRVRMGFVIAGIPVICHEFLNANAGLSTVYMSTPNNPLRYEIENDGTGGAATLTHICSTIMSEGGQEELGIIHYASTGGTHVDANAADTLYAIVGIRLKSTHLDAVVKELNVSVLAKTNDDFEWVLMINPTIAGTFTYSNHDSAVQVATGATANTVTGGHELTGGFGAHQAASSESVPSALWLGAAIDGTPDELVLCVRPMSTNADIEGGMTWRELT